jgi:serine protease Do
VAETAPGKEVPIEIFRDGKLEKVTIKIGDLDGKGTIAGKPENVKKLGMTLQTLTAEEARNIGLRDGTTGVLITEVEPDGLASFAGLQPKQVITSLNGHPVATVDQFEKELTKKDLKEGVRLHVKSAQGSRFVYLKDEGKP